MAIGIPLAKNCLVVIAERPSGKATNLAVCLIGWCGVALTSIPL